MEQHAASATAVVLAKLTTNCNFTSSSSSSNVCISAYSAYRRKYRTKF